MKTVTNFFLVCVMAAAFCFTGCNPKTDSNQVPVVKTTSGAISGIIDDGIFTFRGIPYAKAARFMPPQDPDAWEGILECNDFGPVARQIVPWYPDSVQDENTLFSVNAWTQGIMDGKKRPVMLWLHGGGFHVGASNDPMTYGKAMAKKGMWFLFLSITG